MKVNRCDLHERLPQGFDRSLSPFRVYYERIAHGIALATHPKAPGRLAVASPSFRGCSEADHVRITSVVQKRQHPHGKRAIGLENKSTDTKTKTLTIAIGWQAERSVSTVSNPDRVYTGVSKPVRGFERFS